MRIPDEDLINYAHIFLVSKKIYVCVCKTLNMANGRNKNRKRRELNLWT